MTQERKSNCIVELLTERDMERDRVKEALIDGAIILEGEGYPEIADILRDIELWLPSKEQIEALECAERWYCDNMGCNDALWELLCNLKKLC